MIWGVLPIRPNMSWELHLGGAILGVAMAIVFRRWDVTPVKRYSWEEDDSVPDWFPQKEPPLNDSSREASGSQMPAERPSVGRDTTHRESE